MEMTKPDLGELTSRMDDYASSGKSADETVNSCFKAIIEALQAERGFILLYDKMTSHLKAVTGHQVRLENLFTTEEVSQTIINVVMKDEKSILSTNAMEDPRFKSKLSVLISGIRSVICAPLRSSRGLFGLLYLDNRFANNFYTQKDKKYFNECAQKLSQVIENLYPDLGYKSGA